MALLRCPCGRKEGEEESGGDKGEVLGRRGDEGDGRQGMLSRRCGSVLVSQRTSQDMVVWRDHYYWSCDEESVLDFSSDEAMMNSKSDLPPRPNSQPQHTLSIPHDHRSTDLSTPASSLASVSLLVAGVWMHVRMKGSGGSSNHAAGIAGAGAGAGNQSFGDWYAQYAQRQQAGGTCESSPV